MIRHLHASARRDGGVACALRRRGRGRAGASRAHCARYEMARRSQSGPGGADGRAPADPSPSSMRLFPFAGACAAHPRAAATRSAFDLIFVHCSSVAHYVERHRAAFRRSWTSATWTRRSGSSTRVTSRSRCRLGYRLEGAKMVAEEKRLARRFDVCTATTRAEWQTLEGYRTGTPADWFPNGVDADYFAADRRAVRSGHHLRSSGGWTITRTSNACSSSVANVLPLLRRRRPATEAADRRRRPFARGARASRRCPASRSPVRCPTCGRILRRSALMVAPLNIARGTQNKILEAMAMGVPVVTSTIAAGGVDADRRRALPGRADARGIRGRRHWASSSGRDERARLAACRSRADAARITIGAAR